jgi:hypothetical protein
MVPHRALLHRAVDVDNSAGCSSLIVWMAAAVIKTNRARVATALR